jgi:formimidoylglutamate deiminase
VTRTLLVPELVLEPGARVRAGAAVELDGDRIAAVVDAGGAGERADVVRLPGRLLVPGLVNGHSHAFQRHLRGRVEVRASGAPDDDFWSWREAMYAAAEALDPRGMRAVAEECFDAGRRAGYTSVGEFHYVHHRPDGVPYEEPNELALAVIEGARAAGVRIVLLMAAYARGGAGRGPTPGQRRFCDRTVELYLRRVERLADAVADDPLVTVGYAPHSLRAVPREWLVAIARHAADTGYPVHVHAGEQPREVEESLEEFGLRPIEHLADCGVLGEMATVVHATHVSERELDLLASSRATVCACPTTEANLGDGFLPAEALWGRGVPVSFGADSNVRLDPFEEARETEGCARRQSGRRNVLVAPGDGGPAPSLWRCLTGHGARSLGLEEPALDEGAPADLVALDLDHPDIRAVEPEHLPAAVLFSGTAALVRETWVAGRANGV